jgi:hypothetical protein
MDGAPQAEEATEGSAEGLATAASTNVENRATRMPATQVPPPPSQLPRVMTQFANAGDTGDAGDVNTTQTMTNHFDQLQKGFLEVPGVDQSVAATDDAEELSTIKAKTMSNMVEDLPTVASQYGGCKLL